MKKGDFFIYVQHENQPIPSTLTIRETREKAIKVESESRRFYWLPISALQEHSRQKGVFTLAPWFKRKPDCPNIY
jgi:hypothetical protein